MTTDTENQAEQKMRRGEKHQAIISDTNHRHVALAHPSISVMQTENTHFLHMNTHVAITARAKPSSGDSR